MLECGFQFVQMLGSLVLPGGLRGRHCRLSFLPVNYLTEFFVHTLRGNVLQIAVRAGGFSAIVVVGMAVIGIAILYSAFHVWLDVGSSGSTKVTDCMWLLPLLSLLYDLIFINILFVSYSKKRKKEGKKRRIDTSMRFLIWPNFNNYFGVPSQRKEERGDFQD